MSDIDVGHGGNTGAEESENDSDSEALTPRTVEKHRKKRRKVDDA